MQCEQITLSLVPYGAGRAHASMFQQYSWGRVPLFTVQMAQLTSLLKQVSRISVGSLE